MVKEANKLDLRYVHNSMDDLLNTHMFELEASFLNWPRIRYFPKLTFLWQLQWYFHTCHSLQNYVFHIDVRSVLPMNSIDHTTLNWPLAYELSWLPLANLDWNKFILCCHYLNWNTEKIRWNLCNLWLWVINHSKKLKIVVLQIYKEGNCA